MTLTGKYIHRCNGTTVVFKNFHIWNAFYHIKTQAAIVWLKKKKGDAFYQPTNQRDSRYTWSRMCALVFPPGNSGRKISREIWGFEIFPGSLCRNPGYFFYIRKGFSGTDIYHTDIKSALLFFAY